MSLEFSISILAYQNIALTRKCIDSVLTAKGNFELLLTDNGCQDGTGAYFDELAAKYPNIRVFHYPKNLGFIEPNRIAFKVAKGKYFILLNNDTIVPSGWLNLIKAPFVVDPKCAITGPSGGCSQLRSDFHGESGPRFEYLEGWLLCLDTEKVRSVEPDLFPPELQGAYGEDSYISLRMREAGYNLHRVALNVTHYRCATSAMVPQCREWQNANHAFLQNRFSKYIMGHTFAYPTIIRRRAAWGDVLLTTAIIRALKSLRPMSPILIETICPDVFHGNPDVTHVSNSILDRMDAVTINLNGISEMNCGIPILDAYAQCAGIELDDEVTAMYPPQGDIEWAQRTVPGGDWIALGIGPTSWRCKNWPMDRWSKVIAELKKRGHRIALVGSEQFPAFDVDCDLRGKTNVCQLAALLKECRLFIGLDSFPIHVAQAMRTPVVGLFGITSPELILTSGSAWKVVTSKADHPATGLRHRSPGKTLVDYPDNPMETITVEQVLEVIYSTIAAGLLA